MPRGWIKLLSFLLIEKATGLSFRCLYMTLSWAFVRMEGKLQRRWRLSRSLTSSTVQCWAFSGSVSGWVSHDTGMVLQNEYSIICQTGGLNEYEKWGARGWQSACSRPCSIQSVQGCCSGVVQEGNAWRIRYVEQLLLAWSWRMPGDVKSFKPRISPYMKYFFTLHV